MATDDDSGSWETDNGSSAGPPASGKANSSSDEDDSSSSSSSSSNSDDASGNGAHAPLPSAADLERVVAITEQLVAHGLDPERPNVHSYIIHAPSLVHILLLLPKPAGESAAAARAAIDATAEAGLLAEDLELRVNGARATFPMQTLVCEVEGTREGSMARMLEELPLEEDSIVLLPSAVAAATDEGAEGWRRLVALLTAGRVLLGARHVGGLDFRLAGGQGGLRYTTLFNAEALTADEDSPIYVEKATDAEAMRAAEQDAEHGPARLLAMQQAEARAARAGRALVGAVAAAEAAAAPPSGAGGGQQLLPPDSAEYWACETVAALLSRCGRPGGPKSAALMLRSGASAAGAAGPFSSSSPSLEHQRAVLRALLHGVAGADELEVAEMMGVPASVPGAGGGGGAAAAAFPALAAFAEHFAAGDDDNDDNGSGNNSNNNNNNNSILLLCSGLSRVARRAGLRQAAQALGGGLNVVASGALVRANAAGARAALRACAGDAFAALFGVEGVSAFAGDAQKAAAFSAFVSRALDDLEGSGSNDGDEDDDKHAAYAVLCASLTHGHRLFLDATEAYAERVLGARDDDALKPARERRRLTFAPADEARVARARRAGVERLAAVKKLEVLRMSAKLSEIILEMEDKVALRNPESDASRRLAEHVAKARRRLAKTKAKVAAAEAKLPAEVVAKVTAGEKKAEKDVPYALESALYEAFMRGAAERRESRGGGGAASGG